jgi:hypothetical protein
MEGAHTMINSRAILLLLINLLLPQQVFSQGSVEWSDPFEMDDDDEDVTRYEAPGNNSLAVHVKNGGGGYWVKLRLYDASGKVIKSNKFVANGYEYALVEMADAQYILTRRLTFGALALTAYVLDPQVEDTRPDGVDLSRIPIQPVGGSAEYQVNNDGTKLFVIEIPRHKRGSRAKWNVKAFDQKLHLLNAREFTINYDQDLFRLRQLKVDNKDNLVLTCFLYESKPSGLGKLPPYELLVFTLKSGSTELKEIPISMPGAIPQQVTYLDHGDNSFTCYGLYGKSRQGYASGAFTARFNVDGAITKALSLRAFPTEVMELASRRGASKKESEAFRFVINVVKERPDGGIEFVAEQRNDYYMSFTSSATYDHMTTTTTISGIQYNHDDILVFSLFPDQGKDWYTLLRKRQASFGDKNYLSYGYGYRSNGNLYIVYNDLEENLQVQNNEEPKNLKSDKNRMVTVLATVDPNGKMARTTLFKKADVGHWFIPSLTRRDGDLLLLTATAKKTYRVGKLSMP